MLPYYVVLSCKIQLLIMVVVEKYSSGDVSII